EPARLVVPRKACKMSSHLEAELTMPLRILPRRITRSTLCCALLAALVLSSTMTARSCNAQASQPAGSRPSGFAPLPKVTSPRLYVIDCGTLVYNRPEDYGLTREEVADTNMPVPCFLVLHPKGLLLFDTGLSDRLVGRPLYENVDEGYGQIKFTTLRSQLADIGVTPADITYLAISHSHFDHVGNANDYAGSTWLTQKAELDFMFGSGADKAYIPLYDALARAHQVVFRGDHDVFGDGTVILKFAPGHTPGHQSLYVKLVHSGSVVIAGDLYHYAEERALHRMPKEEETTGTSASREMIDRFLKEKNAQLWIGHSTAFFRNAVKSPGWYD
ncbi:MAG TPA: N-acyl homoserine lactonase family protein, partial [Stellaceae bacterium]|nr:N-acyl homoserine lactonase family protein [Stellaceae bacterium]